jgi:hypothetical protein
MKNEVKIAVYTCITGNYDKLIPPRHVDSRLDYFCFTDNEEIIDAPWSFKSLALSELDNKDKNRYVKMHPHKLFPDYDMTVYLDGNIEIVGDLYDFILNMYAREESLFVYNHLERNCIYSEAAACAYYSHYWLWNVAKQMRTYSAIKYPMNNGLVSANILIRKNTSALAKLMDAWWEAYCSGVKRDQLSLPFVSWKLDIPIHYLGQNDFRYFQSTVHLVKKGSLKITTRKYLNRMVAFFIPYKILFSIPLKISRKKPFLSI